MSGTNPTGTWILKRTGHVKSPSGVPATWRTPSSAERIVVRSDGTFTRHLGAGPRNGSWSADAGEAITMQENGFDPVRVSIGEGTLQWREADEEHGGLIVLEYAPEPAFSLDDAAAKLKKNRDPAKLIAREGWVQRALREGNVELLTLCLSNKAGIYPDTLRDLDACPPAALPAIASALLAQPTVRMSLMSYLPDAGAAVMRALLASPEGAATADTVALAMAKAPNGKSVESFELACAAASTLDLRDTAGVPLLFHVVLSAPISWLPIALRRADRTIRLNQPARLSGDWNAVEAPAGIDVVEAAALCCGAIESMPNKEPWRLASMAQIREKAAMIRPATGS